MELKLPYYNRYDTPKLENRIQKAVFNGRATKVKQLLQNGHNLYETTNINESTLFMAIAQDHLDIANALIDIYEQDLKKVAQHFQSFGITSKFWVTETMLIAYGKDHTDFVKKLAMKLNVNDPVQYHHSGKKGLIILLKESNYSVPEVLWFSPKCENDAIIMAQIIEHIIFDGTLDVTQKEHWGRTFIDLAASRNHQDIFFRLVNLYGTKYLSNIELLKLFCFMSARKPENRVHQFKQLILRLNKFELADVVENDWSILTSPLYSDDFDIFEYIMEVIAQIRVDRKLNETRTEALQYIIDNHIEQTSNIIQSLVLCDRLELALKCLKYNPDLLKQGNFYDIPLFVFFQVKTKPDVINSYFIDNFPRIQELGYGKKVVKKLIKNNWVEAIKGLYAKYPSVKEFLFEIPTKGLSTLLYCIDACHYDVVDYLILAHSEQLTSSSDILELILYCSFVQKGYNILQLLLKLPNADPCLLLGEQQSWKTPFYTTLHFHQLENYKLLQEHTMDKTKLIGEFVVFFVIFSTSIISIIPVQTEFFEIPKSI